MQDLYRRYFNLRYCEEITDFQKISHYKNIPIENIKTQYSSLKHFFCEELGITTETYQKIIQYFRTFHILWARYRNNDRVQMMRSYDEFMSWYEKQNNQCCYCGVKEEDLKLYFNDKNPQYYIDANNHARQRGKILEIERIKTSPQNANVYMLDNCALVCYVCNNAKSDFISAKNFKPIAKGIYSFWKEVVGIEIDFPKESEIWNID